MRVIKFGDNSARGFFQKSFRAYGEIQLFNEHHRGRRIIMEARFNDAKEAFHQLRSNDVTNDGKNEIIAGLRHRDPIPELFQLGVCKF